MRRELERDLTDVLKEIEKRIQEMDEKVSKAIDELLEISYEVIRKGIEVDESYDEKQRKVLDTLMNIESDLSDLLVTLYKIHATVVNYIQGNLDKYMEREN